MNIYLIRHGDAESASIGKKDFARELTSKGKEATQIAAEKWFNFINKLDYIFVSPYKRAYQTAEIIADVFSVKENLIKEDKLAPGSITESIIEFANSLKSENIAFVGHQPDMSDHVSKLVSSSGANISFKKSAIAKISFDGKVRVGNGTLEFLIPVSAFK